jgi:hypothetical protein
MLVSNFLSRNLPDWFIRSLFLRLGSFDIGSEPPVKSRFLWLVSILGIDLPDVDFDINNSSKNRDFLITCAFSERVRDIAFVPNETPPTLS